MFSKEYGYYLNLSKETLIETIERHDNKIEELKKNLNKMEELKDKYYKYNKLFDSIESVTAHPVVE